MEPPRRSARKIVLAAASPSPSVTNKGILVLIAEPKRQSKTPTPSPKRKLTRVHVSVPSPKKKSTSVAVRVPPSPKKKKRSSVLVPLSTPSPKRKSTRVANSISSPKKKPTSIPTPTPSPKDKTASVRVRVSLRNTKKRSSTPVPEPSPSPKKKKPTSVSVLVPKTKKQKLDVTNPEEEAKIEKLQETKRDAYQLRKCPLPCRETQFGDILAFLESNLELRNSGCMYVSGVPGTGKTAIVNAVLEVFRESHKEKQGEVFKDIYINGLTLSAPNRIWKRFYKELNPGLTLRLTPDSAYQKLNLYFEKQHQPIVLIIDELDQILDKQQAILYRLLDWTAHPSNLFSLICIFNTMHLPEIVLTMRNASRMGMARCAFPPYTHEELSTIVRRALGNEKSGQLDEALMLVSRKVAAISGDARRALEIAKRTLEILQSNDEGGSSASAPVVAVGKAFKELFSSPKIEAVKQCSQLEKFALRAIMGNLQTSGSEETKVDDVMNSVFAFTNMEGFDISVDQVIHVLRNLHGARLILMENGTTSLYNKISLNVSVPDIQYGLGAAETEL